MFLLYNIPLCDWTTVYPLSRGWTCDWFSGFVIYRALQGMLVCMSPGGHGPVFLQDSTQGKLLAQHYTHNQLYNLVLPNCLLEGGTIMLVS